ncbi:hypothetical protein CB0940_06219 [Cercospora beticola]|uniref:Uncharacterized protein n=1 Tax=Cercospora beticola TaxID=122368 RepID=A0A2G5HWW2_CERBT|nr:hypothetical protein CB0940_06219 [Cercospora beticola]PIA97054.1 hypothetical protein CB0940_06219 [Cercospora beticola]WPA98836.1 hypothetical protein RHO25_003449 [Cercospora beticola]
MGKQSDPKITAILHERGIWDEEPDLSLHRCPHTSFAKDESVPSTIAHKGLSRKTSVQEMKSFIHRMWHRRSSLQHDGHKVRQGATVVT